MEVRVRKLIERSVVAFARIGACGLDAAMTDRVCYVYTEVFLRHMQLQGGWQGGVAVALPGELRPSTLRIMSACAQAVRDLGGRSTSAASSRLPPSPTFRRNAVLPRSW